MAIAEPLVFVESFGYLHAPPPPAHVTLDLRELLHNPHADPLMREQTGLDAEVRDHVLRTLGTKGIITSTLRMIATLVSIQMPRGGSVRVAVGCAGGRHRSVAVAEELVRVMVLRGFEAVVSHRDVLKPVVTSRDGVHGG